MEDFCEVVIKKLVFCNFCRAIKRFMLDKFILFWQILNNLIWSSKLHAVISFTELPLDPSLSRTLIEANELGCLSQALTVAAVLSAEITLRQTRR